jgi:UDP-GlcNAc3NAcA epimerase
MKIVTILGARPQFIKASVVSAELAKHEGINEVVVHTGQHFDANMSDVFFQELGMAKPDHHLDIHGGTHGEMTGRMLEGVERVLMEEKGDVVLVYGDTNSTLAGALAAAKLHIPVAHVEAGLRSFNMCMPEEINRILTDRVSQWLFAPTAEAVQQLTREGVNASLIYQTGDVMFDVALHHGARAGARADSMVHRLELLGKEYVLATVHRAENTSDLGKLKIVIDAFSKVAQHLPVIWPLHPRTRGILEHEGLLHGIDDGILMVEPLGYLDMLALERAATVIATDSGGVQKEAFFSGIPCITLRNETEWKELVDAGWNTLVPLEDSERVANAILSAKGERGRPCNPYGDGQAAKRIVHAIINDARSV